MLSKQHQIIHSICQASKTVVDHTISYFNKTSLISKLVLSRSVFESQSNAIVNQLIKLTPLDFRRLIRITIELLETNLIPTAFGTDWSIEYGNASNDYLMRNIPRMYTNGTCNCVVSNECQEPLKIGPSYIVLPGLVIGCSPLDGLRMSTLECFFSSSCINTILSYLEYDTLPDKSHPTNFSLPEVLPLIISPLNESKISRFLPTTPIGTLIDELFIENWENISSYESYFAACSPTACNYEYSERRSIIYIITTLLSLYGGLTISLRFIVWNVIRIQKGIKLNGRANHVQVRPQSDTN